MFNDLKLTNINNKLRYGFVDSIDTSLLVRNSCGIEEIFNLYLVLVEFAKPNPSLICLSEIFKTNV